MNQGSTRRRVLDLQPKNPVVSLKLLTIGECETGKSCIIKRYCESKFITRYLPTIGIDFGVKRIELKQNAVKLGFWDCSGAAIFEDVRNEFYKDIDVLIFVYDVTRRGTFDRLDFWIEEYNKYANRPLGGKNQPFVITVANKQDLCSRPGFTKQVTENEAIGWCQLNNFEYIETSAQSGQGIPELFTTCIDSGLRSLPKIPKIR
eukprot:TRINITY_DN1891_c0_g1_i1.p1 TRINITY_DN1891_c0_g1~~TRINITY_DN1891_c0_g1_i1.p1  ORF type:complete len:204 (-),score=47.67 TRINITY_DN1891_c0_g1_i1:73-684(-)